MDSAKNRKMREGNIRSQTHPKPEKSECKIAAVHHSQSRCPAKRRKKEEEKGIWIKYFGNLKGRNPLILLTFAAFLSIILFCKVSSWREVEKNDQNLSAKEAAEKERARLQKENGYQKWPQSSRTQKSKRQKAAELLIAVWQSRPEPLERRWLHFKGNDGL